jgi:hypothetical protein
VSSILGFCLDVLVYHTFSLFVRSIMKLLVGANGKLYVLRTVLHAHLLFLCVRVWYVYDGGRGIAQITVSVATDRSTLASGLARGLEVGSCAFSGANSF